jgi:hypothetical protein
MKNATLVPFAQQKTTRSPALFTVATVAACVVSGWHSNPAHPAKGTEIDAS